MRGEGGVCFGRHARTSSHSSRSEFDFIKLIQQKASKLRRREASSLISPPSSLVHGIGDDAAVIKQRSGFDIVTTSDLLVEEIDFRLSTTTPRLLGHKALAVSLSDIAAMGARPLYALLSIGVPALIWQSSFLEEFYAGFFALASRQDVRLIGGDVSRTPERVIIDSIVMGEVRHNRAVLRSTARAGDHIFVTGSLGGAHLGLKFLEREGKSRISSTDEPFVKRLIKRHRRPEPRLAWGSLLCEERLASAMIDISDGLSSDLAHLCHESKAGAILDAERIPLDKSALQLGKRLPVDALSAALNGGEDFELLFTVAPRNLSRLPRRVRNVPATYIGDITDEGKGITLLEGASTRRLKSGGFTHFS